MYLKTELGQTSQYLLLVAVVSKLGRGGDNPSYNWSCFEVSRGVITQSSLLLIQVQTGGNISNTIVFQL